MTATEADEAAETDEAADSQPARPMTPSPRAAKPAEESAGDDDDDVTAVIDKVEADEKAQDGDERRGGRPGE